MKNMNNTIVIIITLVLLQFAKAQDLLDARSVGMAFSNTAITEGLEHIGGNPATLAVPQNFNFEMNLISVRAMIKNNGLSMNFYNKYFTTGDSLTSHDVDDLLSQIPDQGLRTDALVNLMPISFYSRYFSLSFQGMGNAYVNIPKSPLTLPFKGNRDGNEYTLDDLKGEAWAAAAATFSLGLPLTKYVDDQLEFFSAGLSLKYIRGFQYAKIQEAQGGLFTYDTYILANGYMEQLHSAGGSGFGLDAGVLAKSGDWTLSLNVTNALGSIRWNTENELQVMEFSSDTLRLNKMDDLETSDTDTTYPAGSFSTALPRNLTIAGAYQLRHNVVVTAAYRQGLNKSLGNYTRPLLAVGTEYKPISVFPLRMGFNAGGNNGFSLGLGMGIDLKYWQLNLAYLNHNMRWFNSSRSMELAVTSRFRF